MDTIYALSTARGKAGLAVVRVSGPQAIEAARALCGDVPAPRTAGLRKLKDSTGVVLDEALVLVFEAGRSFTGEDTVEFQIHGSPAVVRAVEAALSQHGLRIAEPGEFTRRALENERLDIAQVEGLGDLIDAETEAQRKQALRVFSGALGQKVETWRADLISAAALLEATIDFADEDVPVDVGPEVSRLLGNVRADFQAEAEGAVIAERIRDGFEVAIVGAPNVGKSTLLNALAGRDAAITSEIAGTTRDVIEVRMDLRGLPITVLDTAGLRQSDDQVESLGIARARERAGAADLRVMLVDGDAAEFSPRAGDIVVQAKADLRTDGKGVSGLTGQGVDALVSRIAGILENRASGAMTATRARHRAALLAATEELTFAEGELAGGAGRAELAAEHTRRAIRALELLVGYVDVEHVLDEIFARFCLGK